MKAAALGSEGRRGAATVEYALTFLMFFAILLAIMDYSRFVASSNLLAAAAREGARYAIVHGSGSRTPADASVIEQQVKRWCIGLTRDQIAVTTTWPDGSNARGNRVQVLAVYRMRPFTGIIMNPMPGAGRNGIFTGTLTLASRSEMLISQ